jgi:phosphotriesterase-related protein
MSELSPAHVRSGQVMTVLGPVPVGDLGLTLMHEHILNDCSCWWHRPGPDRALLADAPLAPSILWELRQDPFVNRENLALEGFVDSWTHPTPAVYDPESFYWAPDAEE